MSEVVVVKIRNNKFDIARIHFSKIKEFLETESSIEELLDEGYLIADLDRKIIINRQNAVDIRKMIKGAEVFEL